MSAPTGAAAGTSTVSIVGNSVEDISFRFSVRCNTNVSKLVFLRKFSDLCTAEVEKSKGSKVAVSTRTSFLRIFDSSTLVPLWFKPLQARDTIMSVTL